MIAGPAGLSVKQRDSILDATCRINVWEGAIRSGKTIGSIVAWLMFIRTGPPGPLAMIGKTRDTVYRNVIDVMAELLPGAVVYTRGAPTIRVLGRLVHVMGANDARSEGRLRGLTLAGAYVDEITLVAREFFAQLLGRMSVPGARLFGTTNPDAPTHWLMKDFLAKEKLELDDPERPDLVSFHFRLEDNPSLEDDYVRKLKSELTGLWYKRFIDGLWVAAEGAIYDCLDDAVHARPAPDRARWQAAWIGLDYGTSNPTHAVLIVLAADDDGTPRLWVVAEWQHDGRKNGQLTNAQISARLARWAEPYLAGLGAPTVALDPSAAGLRVQMRADGWPGLKSADNRVEDGLRAVASLFGGARLLVDTTACPVLWEQLQGYVWDPKALDRGVEQPLKQDDHGCDALRYGVMQARRVWRAWLPDLAALETPTAA